jgi:type II secretory pathway predicted ATPase ExeA
LGNLETRKGKLLQIVIAGQQELDAKLDQPQFRPLKQRISLRCALRGFDVDEAAAYIDSRMARAGVREQTIIPLEIIHEIHYRSQGIPRLINGICDNLLLTSFAMESKTATLEMLDEVTADMHLDYPEKALFQQDTPIPA